MARRIAVLGSTGSIGTQTLDVARRHPDKIEVVALAVGRRVKEALEQAEEFGVRYVASSMDAGELGPLALRCPKAWSWLSVPMP